MAMVDADLALAGVGAGKFTLTAAAASTFTAALLLIDRSSLQMLHACSALLLLLNHPDLPFQLFNLIGWAEEGFS